MPRKAVKKRKEPALGTRRSERVRQREENETGGSGSDEARGSPETEATASTRCVVVSPAPSMNQDVDYHSFFCESADDDATVVNQPRSRAAPLGQSGGVPLVQPPALTDAARPAAAGRGQVAVLTSTRTSGTGNGTPPPATSRHTEPEKRQPAGKRLAAASTRAKSLLQELDDIVGAGIGNAFALADTTPLINLDPDEDEGSRRPEVGSQQHAGGYRSGSGSSGLGDRLSWERHNPVRPSRERQMGPSASTAPPAIHKGREEKDGRHVKSKKSSHKHSRRSPSTSSASSSSSSAPSSASGRKRRGHSKSRRPSKENRRDSRKGSRRQERPPSSSSSSSGSSSSGSRRRSRRRSSRRHQQQESAANYWSGTIEKFSGHAGEDVNYWINQFRDATSSLDEKMRMAEFKKAMTDEAKAWYKRQFDADHRRNKKTPCKGWTRRLREEFKTEPHKLDQLEANYHQKLGQPASDYVARKLELIEKAHDLMDNARKVRKLQEGVHKAYKTQVQGQLPVILNSGSKMIKLFTDTLAEQMTIFDSQPYGGNVFVSQQSDDGKRQKKDEAAPKTTAGGSHQNASEPTEEHAVDDLSRRVANVMQSTFPVTDPYPSGGRYMGNKRQAAPNECFGCYGTDHQYAQCSSNPRNRRQSGRQQNAYQQGPAVNPPPAFQQQPPVFQQQPPAFHQQPPAFQPPPVPQQQPAFQPQPQFQQPPPFQQQAPVFQQQPQVVYGPPPGYQQPMYQPPFQQQQPPPAAPSNFMALMPPQPPQSGNGRPS